MVVIQKDNFTQRSISVVALIHLSAMMTEMSSLSVQGPAHIYMHIYQATPFVG